MASPLSRITRHVWVQHLQRNSRLLFSKYLLFTNTGIAVGLSACGDLLQQYYERLCRRQVTWNSKRTRNVAISGLALGPACHYWYLFLDRVFPGRRPAMIARKIFLDQVIISPVCVTVFVLTVGAFEGMYGKRLLQELKEKGPPLLKAEWLVWPPVQLVNFCFLPTRFRVLYDNTVSLGFDCYYSYVMYRKDKALAESGDLAMVESSGSDWEQALPHTGLRRVPSPLYFTPTCNQLTQSSRTTPHLDSFSEWE